MSGAQPGAVGVVLAAGLGTRMRPLTDDRPKALVAVAQRTLLDRALDRYAEAGVSRAVVNVHHFADDVERHLAARAGAPAVTLSDERDVLLETGGAMVRARPLLGPEAVFVANVDSLWEVEAGGVHPLAALRARWDDACMDALLLLADTGRCSGYGGAGDFHLGEDGRLIRRGGDRVARYAYMGVQLLHPRALDGFAAEPFSLNKVWDAALAKGRVFGLPFEGFWMHVGDPQARLDAERRLDASHMTTSALPNDAGI